MKVKTLRADPSRQSRLRLYAHLDSLLIQKLTEWLRVLAALFLCPRDIKPRKLPVTRQTFYVSSHLRRGYLEGVKANIVVAMKLSRKEEVGHLSHAWYGTSGHHS